MPEKINRKSLRRNEIVHAAAAVFSKTGFIRSTIAEIAKKAGIGKGTVYEYFSSKEDLFFAVFESYWHEAAQKAVVRIGALGQSASLRLLAMNEALMADWREMTDSFPLVMEFWAASGSPSTTDRFKEAFRRGYMDFRKMVEALIRDGMDRGEFKADIDEKAVAAALVGAWDALYLQAWFDEDFDPSYTAKRFLPILIEGMKT